MVPKQAFYRSNVVIVELVFQFNRQLKRAGGGEAILEGRNGEGDTD